MRKKKMERHLIRWQTNQKPRKKAIIVNRKLVRD
jgi:hypothetical protein